MACKKCGVSGSSARKAIVSASTSSRLSYPMAGYPNCSTLYAGPHEGDSLYVVGRLTEHERVFTRAHLGAASTYAREVRLDLENIPTTALCDRAVVDAFAQSS